MTMILLESLVLQTRALPLSLYLYTGCPKKKRNGGFSVPCILKVVYFLTSLDKASSAEENDTKIIKFGSVLFILRPFLEMQSFSNFAGFLRRMSEGFWRDKHSVRCIV